MSAAINTVLSICHERPTAPEVQAGEDHGFITSFELPPDEKDNFENKSRVGESNSVDNYAFTFSEPTKLDTGEDYHKLPISTYCKVVEVEGEKARVHRITGAVADSARDGWIAIDKLKFAPKQFVPPQVLIAQACLGKHVQLQSTKEDFPYFSAGPNSRILNADVIIKVKDLEGDCANISVYENCGKLAGFGKIRICHLQDASVVSLPLYTPT
jgi:hypothetical protein